MTEPYYNVSQIELEEDEKEDLESDDAVGFSSSKPIFLMIWTILKIILKN